MKNPMRIVDSNFDRLQARKGTATKNNSQMEKITAMLQIGSKAGPDEAQIILKAEQRVTALKALRVSLAKATTAVSKLYVVEKPQQLKKLTAALKTIQTIAQSKPPVGVQKHLKAAMNELTSLREGVYVGAATSQKALSIVSCTDALYHVDELIVKATASYESKKVTAASDDPLFTEEIEKVIQQTAEESRKLASLHDKDWVVSRMPVIPLAKASNKAATGFLSVQALQRAGIKAESLGGYPVLHNQLVLGINPKAVGLTEAQKKAGKSIPREKWLAVADAIRKLLEKQTRQKYQFVDERAYGAAGGAWFWLMPERELDLFASAFPGKAVTLLNWGFASGG
jgi:hypothetical protein